MNVRFGNLSVSQFEEKTQVKLSPEDKRWMEEHRQDSANEENPNKFHIFDLPFGITAGENVGAELVRRLRAYRFERHFTVETRKPD